MVPACELRTALVGWKACLCLQTFLSAPGVEVSASLSSIVSENTVSDQSG